MLQRTIPEEWTGVGYGSSGVGGCQDDLSHRRATRLTLGKTWDGRTLQHPDTPIHAFGNGARSINFQRVGCFVEFVTMTKT